MSEAGLQQMQLHRFSRSNYRSCALIILCSTESSLVNMRPLLTKMTKQLDVQETITVKGIDNNISWW